ncbi:iron permease FTR1 family protein [Cytobacillus depressus]|uniref:Iron permease FTR1 family protein n=1 Tax=Cytobacillus depressus TaxID=1602942 RepID=A0A6L3UXP6_9BACI|nr:iron permease FTR1 family protein [Cytobacillus depressus]
MILIFICIYVRCLKLFKRVNILVIILYLVSLSIFSIGFAEENTARDAIKTLIPLLEKVEIDVSNDDLEKANLSFNDYKNQFLKLKNDIRSDSIIGYSEIESKTAALTISLLNEDKNKSLTDISSLTKTIKDYSDDTLNDHPNKIEKMSLSSYITLLKNAKESISNKDMNQAIEQVQQLRKDWLGVEGDVVSQSQSIYNNSEKHLVLLEGYIQQNNFSKVSKILDQMITDLEPLQKDSYGIWDAALIPIREGVEALLVIGSLLAVTKKATVSNGRKWIWGGTISGLLVSMLIGLLVTYFLKAISFGENNFLINGWSGVIASIMLLYVSYWLHRNSNMKNWNSFIKGKTEKAISNGKLISFAVLSFLAILREGLETVIFLIGMVNRMPIEKFLMGIVVGIGILVIFGILMLKVGSFLPLKPFFFVSSIIVFYLCIKFMGTGIHSLQLSGLINSAVNESIPTVSFIGIYPSWYSTLPQLIISLMAVGVLTYQYVNKKKLSKTNGGTTHEVK